MMSYCVNCGVELDQTASSCPLCHTAVINPTAPVDRNSPKPFPTQKGEVPPVSRWELAMLISAMLLSVSLCCGLLNFFLRGERVWSLYVIGASVMLWVFFVPPLVLRRMSLLLRVGLDMGAVADYLYLISVDLNGGNWFLGLGLPIVLLAGAVTLALGYFLRRGRSILSGMTAVIGSIGVFTAGIELLVDRYLHLAWEAGWSIVILAVCVALIIPLIIIRRVPSLREEVRRRFHM